MKLHRFLLVFALVAPLSSTAQLFSKKPKKEPEILIVSDTFGNEEGAVRPSKEKPVSYMIFIGQRRDMGATIAGIKAPTKEEIEGMIHRTMQSQGFVPRDVGEEVPEIFVVYTYGSAYVPTDPSEGIEFDEGTGEFSGQTAVPDTIGEREMFALAGGAKVLQSGGNRLDVEAVQEAAEIDRLFIMIAAVNGPKYHEGKKEVMWRTRISIPSRGFNLPNYLDLIC